MSDTPSFWGLAKRSSSIRIGAGLVGLGLLFVIFVGLDVIEGRWTSSSQAILWVTACIALLGGVLVAIGVRRGRARWRVLDEGLSTEATVTAVTQSRMQTTVHDAPSWTIRYRYQDKRGRIFKGQSGDLSQEEAENWEVGDTASPTPSAAHNIVSLHPPASNLRHPISIPYLLNYVNTWRYRRASGAPANGCSWAVPWS